MPDNSYRARNELAQFGPLPTEQSPTGPLRTEPVPTTRPIPSAATEMPKPIPGTSVGALTPSAGSTVYRRDEPPARQAPPCAMWSDDGSGFLADRWNIPVDLDLALAADAPRLLADQFARVDVVGHTDTRPTPLGNDELSRRRAEAVVERLVQLGVPAELFHVVPRGDRDSVDDGDNEAAYAANRRVDLVAYC